MEMAIENKYKYFAFISYKREDEEWAIWLQHELEYYHLPALLNGREDLPKTFRPVFRDIDELKAGNLPEQIHEALASSAYLIVICSPRSAKSKWVNKEIETFIEIGKEKGINHLEKVFPFIVEGTPHAKDEAQECFPKVLRDLPANQERIGGNVNESGRDKAFIKVMAGMLPNVGMDTLWNRYEHDKAETERKEREQKDKLFISQSRLISREAIDLIHYDSYLARLLALEALPKDLSNPDRPQVIEAESALRAACLSDRTILYGPSSSQDSKQSSFINDAAFSPDGRLVATACDDNKVRLWNVEDGRLLRDMQSDTSVQSVAFSPDGEHLAYGSDGCITIRNLNIITHQTKLRRDWDDFYSIYHISFGPDGKHIVSVHHDLRIVAWNLEKGNFIYLTGHKKAPNSAVFSPDGNHIISAGVDGIMIWDVENGSLIKKLDENHSDFATYSSDGKRILALQHDYSEAKIWDAESETLLNTIHPDEDIFSASFSPDGKLMITFLESEYKLKVWDTESGEVLRTLDVEIDGAAFFGPDAKQIALISGQDVQLIKLDEVAPGGRMNAKQAFKITEASDGSIENAAFSPDGKYIAASFGFNKTLILNAESGAQIHTLMGDNKTFNTSSFSPDGKQIVLNDYGKNITLWDMETGKASFSMKEAEGSSIVDASFSPDGSKILSLTFIDNTYNAIKTWDIATGNPILDVKGCATDNLEFASFSPDGKRIVAAGYNYHITKNSIEHGDGIIVILDSTSGKVAKTIKVAKGSVDFVTVSPNNGQFLTITKGFVTAWDMETGKDLYTLEGGGDFSLASYSPDGKHIVAINKQEGSLIVCDASTGAIIQLIYTKFHDAHSVQFHPDGHHIIATFEEDTIAIFDFPPLQDLIDQTRERFKDRPLTLEERRMYYLE